jgi:hypothetical protein
LVKLGAGVEQSYGGEWFGPISFVIATGATVDSLRISTKRAGPEGRVDGFPYRQTPM